MAPPVLHPRDEAPGLDPTLQDVMKAATAHASRLRQRFVTLEHLFRAALDQPDAVDVMVRCGADVEDLKRELDEYLELLEEVYPRAPLLHPRALGVLRYLLVRGSSAGRPIIGVRELLVGLRTVEEDYASLLMHAAGIERLDLLRVISHGTKDGPAAIAEELARVRVHNDDYTPMEFVIEVLGRVFRLPLDEARRMMLEIHQQGSTLMGVMASSQALERAMEVAELAEQAGYPLRVSVEAA